MKKSYDYFKTLKMLSENVSGAFTATASLGNYETFRLSFLAEKSELLNNLHNEFIAPLERGDIFLLTECLSKELNAVGSLNEFSSLFFSDCFSVSNSLNICFKKQTELLAQLENIKNSSRLCDLCHDGCATALSEQIQLQRKIKIVVSCGQSQPLIKYSVYAVYLDLVKCLWETFSQIERILINNS